MKNALSSSLHVRRRTTAISSIMIGTTMTTNRTLGDACPRSRFTTVPPQQQQQQQQRQQQYPLTGTTRMMMMMIKRIPSGCSCCRSWYCSSKRRFSDATAAAARCDRRNTGSTNTTSTSDTTIATGNSIDEPQGPTGTLFQSSKAPIGPELMGARGRIHRTFGSRSNAEGLLATGGPDLAAHASFDPDYHRAQDWIRHHAVGPAVVSPILIAGLTGALTEAAFPHGVITGQSMQHVRPLIVGVPVASMIEVMKVTKAERRTHNNNNYKLNVEHTDHEPSNENPNPHHQHEEQQQQQHQQRTHGYDVTLRTTVSRVRDDCTIAEGTLELWVPDYLHM